MDSHYPEIDALKEFHSAQKISLSILPESPIEDTSLFNITISNQSFQVIVQDEYGDLALPNTLLHLVLVLNELILINDSTDFLDWCNLQGFQANNTFLLSYYQDMVQLLSGLSKYFTNGKITAFISDWDFQLNAGAAQFLRNTTYN